MCVPGVEVDDAGGDVHGADAGHGEGPVVAPQVRTPRDRVRLIQTINNYELYLWGH